MWEVGNWERNLEGRGWEGSVVLVGFLDSRAGFEFGEVVITWRGGYFEIERRFVFEDIDFWNGESLDDDGRYDEEGGGSVFSSATSEAKS